MYVRAWIFVNNATSNRSYLWVCLKEYGDTVYISIVTTRPRTTLNSHRSLRGVTNNGRRIPLPLGFFLNWDRVSFH